MRPALVLVVLSLTGAVAASSAWAIVPPRDCGRLKVGTRSYTIKADQVRCADAKAHSRRYLTTNRRPSGWTCRRYRASETKLAFRCTRGSRSFFAIRR